MRQQPIAFDVDVNLPVAGRSPQARHSSSTGAQYAARTRGRLSVAYLELLRAAGPLSDFEAAAALGRSVSSMNSTRAGLGSLIAPSGDYEVSQFGTRRVRWRVRP